MPPFIKSFSANRTGFVLVLSGGHRFAYTYESGERPSLPPPTFDTTAEPVSGPSVAKTRPELRVVRSA